MSIHEKLEAAWEQAAQSDRAFRAFACTIIDGAGRTNAGRFTRLLDAEAWLDAALMLVPEEWSVKLYIHPADSEEASVTYADLYLLDMEDRTPNRRNLKSVDAEAPTPAEALLAAIEKART